MRALVFGDLHGHILAMYAFAETWQREEGRTVEAILQVGDFGIYPVAGVQTEEKIARFGASDYPALARSGWAAPIPTWFCRGNNEDFDALGRPLAPELHEAPGGSVRQFGDTRVAFLGGAWSRKSYEGLQPRPQHIARQELEALYDETFDILLCHEAPGGIVLPGGRYPVGAPPLRALIENRRPRLVIHGHHHRHAETMLGPTRVISLARFIGPRSARGAVLPLEL